MGLWVYGFMGLGFRGLGCRIEGLGLSGSRPGAGGVQGFMVPFCSARGLGSFISV